VPDACTIRSALIGSLSVVHLGWRWLDRALRRADIPDWKLRLQRMQPERVAAT
jgi:hypothetical protein